MYAAITGLPAFLIVFVPPAAFLTVGLWRLDRFGARPQEEE